MTRALPFALVVTATPVLAHHEATVVSMVPGLTILALTIGGSAMAFWRIWRNGRK